jgi:alpha-ribazole phosphatase
MELHLIRHPRPDLPPGICYGQSDVGLAEQALDVAARLAPLLPTAFVLYASPLARARLLAEELGDPILDARLMELNFGAWELRPWADFGAALDAWATAPLEFRPPGGESLAELSARVLAWYAELRENAPPMPVVVVAHGGPLRALAGALLGIAPTHWQGLDFACGRVARIDVEPWGAALKWFNR